MCAREKVIVRGRENAIYEGFASARTGVYIVKQSLKCAIVDSQKRFQRMGSTASGVRGQNDSPREPPHGVREGVLGFIRE